jgi:hypothetical protein
MSEALADDLRMDAVLQELSRMGMTLVMKAHARNLDPRDQIAERAAQRVR